MAKQPSITLSQFRGINNRLPAERIKNLPVEGDSSVDLAAAVNVYIDNSGKPDVRDGFALYQSIAGAHSGYGALGVCLYVKAGTLYRFYPGPKTSVPLVDVYADSKMRYCTGAGRIFFTNGVVIGEVKEGVAALFEAPEKDFKEMLPPGQAIAFFRGRLYTFLDDVLCMSDAVHLARMDSEHGFKPFPEKGKVIAPTLDGLYVGTEKAVYHASGGVLGKMAFATVATCAAKDVPVQYIDASQLKSVNIEGRFPIIHTDDGVCVGLPQGQLVNMTEAMYDMPAGTTGASYLKDIDGQKYYISAYR